MRYRLRNLILAIPFFGVSAFALATHLRSVEIMRNAQEKGIIIYTAPSMHWVPCLFAAGAGLAVLFGRYRICALLAIPVAIWFALVFMV